MKWVWNQDKTKTLDIATGHVLAIIQTTEPTFRVRFDTSHIGGRIFLRTFPTLQAAQEFISNLTGAVNGGKHE